MRKVQINLWIRAFVFDVRFGGTYTQIHPDIRWLVQLDKKNAVKSIGPFLEFATKSVNTKTSMQRVLTALDTLLCNFGILSDIELNYAMTIMEKYYGCSDHFRKQLFPCV